METLTCFGSFCLSLWLCALVSFWRDLTKNKASREGRGCAHRALLLLPSLLLFSSFSFGSSSISGSLMYSSASNSNICTSSMSACSYVCSVNNSGTASSATSTSCTCNDTANQGGYPVYSMSSCSSTCTVPSGTPVGEIGSSLTPNSNGVLPGTYCDPSTNCDTQSYSSSAGSGGSMTNGQACFSTGPTSSTSSSSSSCPSGYSVSDASGCVCSNGSGSYVSSYNSSTNPSCNGGSPTAPVLSPVSPVTSNGVTSCPPGSASSTSGSSVSCYQIIVPPPANPQASPSPSGGGGGGGGGSGFHIVAPTKSSNGQYVCPPGASVIGGSTPGSMECVASGSGPISAPTGSGTSATSSASSAPSYPTSISMPALASVGVTTTPLSSLPSANESTSEQCPAPVTFDVMSHTFSITFTYACDLAARVRPVVIGAFSLASLLLIVK